MPPPQRLHVPSSQLGPLLFSLTAGVSPALSSSFAEPRFELLSAGPRSSDADFGSAPEEPPPPHAANSKNTAKQQGNARIVPSVYVPWLRGYKSL